MTPRRNLSQILNDNDKSKLQKAWESAEAAGEFTPLPAGEYEARIISGTLDTAKTGTLGYKIALEVVEGEYASRPLWLDIWLTPAALPMAKRDLLKLGITDLDMLDRPLPQGIRVKVKVALRRDDSGEERNRVKSFEVIGIDPPDAFAPDADANDPKGGDDGLPI